MSVTSAGNNALNEEPPVLVEVTTKSDPAPATDQLEPPQVPVLLEHISSSVETEPLEDTGENESVPLGDSSGTLQDLPVSGKSQADDIQTSDNTQEVALETSQLPEDAPSSPATSPQETEPLINVVAIATQPRSKRRIVAFVLLGLLAVSILAPVAIAIDYGITAYRTYTTLRDEAHSGVQHLLNIKSIFTGIKTHPSGFLDVTKLHLSQKELAAAHSDFQQLQSTLDSSAIIHNVTTYLPQYREQITSARAASQIGIDVTNIGQELVAAAQILAPTFRGPLLNDGGKPLVTAAMLDLVRTTIDDTLPRLSNIQAQTHLLSMSALPISASQRDQFLQLVQLIPQAEADLAQVRGLLGAANWLLGINQPRTFLVQTMDRAELRGTGGFTGQYGELHIDSGRAGPFNLRDISLVEYVDNSPTLNKLPPTQYRSWWPFANWGLRDSNVSADFPTSAQVAISQYKQEVGHSVDGVILFTPFLIEHILQIIGPIQVSGYNETITAQNIEERLHYYQQDNAGILKQIVVQPGKTWTSDRKRFTALLARLLMDHVRHAPPDEIIAIAREMLHDLKTKDLQVYFTNPQVEGLLMQYGDAAQIDTSPTRDGLYVVQANLSASKASQFVHTILHDTVTLDAAGGATHVLQMRLVYNQLGPVYGYDTYRDYVRIYVPPSSILLWGNGFDSGKPLCGGAYYSACPQTGVYSRDELVCPTGQYSAGPAAPSTIDPDGATSLPLDTLGLPTNRTSDQPGRAMFGGWVIVPKNCTGNVTLSWYVPPVSAHSYSLLVQPQASTLPELDLTILPAPGNCAILRVAGQHFDAIMSDDTLFTLKNITTSPANARCYPQPGV